MASYEQDREDMAVYYDCAKPDEESNDERFERLLAEEEKRQRETVKKACIAGLLALGIMPRSLVRERR